MSCILYITYITETAAFGTQVVGWGGSRSGQVGCACWRSSVRYVALRYVYEGGSVGQMNFSTAATASCESVGSLCEVPCPVSSVQFNSDVTAQTTKAK